MKLILKICRHFCNWCEVYRLGATFSDSRFGNWIYRNAHDLEIFLEKKL